MSINVIKYGKTANSRNLIKDIERRVAWSGGSDYPTITYRGTVKLHGTNAAVTKTSSGETVVQSRNQHFPLNVPTDSWQSGWAKFVRENEDVLLGFFPKAEGYNYTLYGEWCGQGIQKGMGISSLPKMFVPFYMTAWTETEGEDPNVLELTHEHAHSPEHKIYNSRSFQTFEITVDFTNPTKDIESMWEIATEIGKSCPVAKALGAEGVGEGVVWVPIEADDPKWLSRDFVFKTVAERHQEVKMPKKAVVHSEADVTFVGAVLTEARLHKGLDFLRETDQPISKRSTGAILKWLVQDIFAEESELLTEFGADEKKVKKMVGQKGRDMYFNYLRHN